LKFVKYSLVLCILINILLVFANVINPSWAVRQINWWVESTHPSNRLLNQDVLKSTPAIALGGEVRAVVETQTPQKD
jgi:hypothetical protein